MFAKRAFFFLNCVINGLAARLLWELPLCDQISKKLFAAEPILYRKLVLKGSGIGGGSVQLSYFNSTLEDQQKSKCDIEELTALQQRGTRPGFVLATYQTAQHFKCVFSV